jgi:hypothetical protein
MLEFLTVNSSSGLSIKAVVAAAFLKVRDSAVSKACWADTNESSGIQMQLGVLALKMNDIVPQT